MVSIKSDNQNACIKFKQCFVKPQRMCEGYSSCSVSVSVCYHASSYIHGLCLK